MAIYFNPNDKLFYNSDFTAKSKITGSFVEIATKQEYYDLIDLVVRGYELDVDEFGGITYSFVGFDPEITIPTSDTTSDYISFFYANIKNLLEGTSISYGYDSIDNAISYYNSGITSWRNEAIAFNTWRDNTVSLMYDNIFSFTADGITLPDLPGFTGQTGYFDVGITSPSRPNLFS